MSSTWLAAATDRPPVTDAELLRVDDELCLESANDTLADTECELIYGHVELVDADIELLDPDDELRSKPDLFNADEDDLPELVLWCF